MDQSNPFQAASMRGAMAVTAIAALLLSWGAMPVEAGVKTLYATLVPPTDDWDFESRAEGAPEDFNCNNSTYASMRASYCNRSTPLIATRFNTYTFPPGDGQITKVQVDVLCRYDTGTSGRVHYRIIAPGVDFQQDSPSFGNPNGDCEWRLSNIEVPRNGGWTPEAVNAMEFRVRRVDALCSNNDTTLRVKAFRVVVTSECADCDGDGVCDDEDNCICDYNPDQEDCDGNGIGDACDEPCDQPCTGLEGVQASCKTKSCGNQLKAMLQNGQPGQTVTFVCDNGHGIQKKVKDNGTAKAKWCPLGAGNHVVALLECPVSTVAGCP